jgi:hypothetical protein
MTRSVVHRLGRLLSAVVLLASGAYVFIYLVRWEWNRALIAGLFFLAAELVLIADVLAARFARLSSQIEAERAREQTTALAARLRANRPDYPGPFAWLAPDRDRLTVFLPILIGAGVVLSAVAYLVEQLSRVTAVPVAEHELARGLSTMALPAEGLAPLGRLPHAPPGSVAAPRAGWVWRWLAAGGLVAVLAAGVLAGAQWLLSIPEEPDPRRAVAVDLVVMRRNLEQPDRDVALALWTTCRVRVPETVRLQSLEPIDDSDPARLRLTMSPRPGESDTREFVGCVQDTVIERVRADVLAVAVIPS